MALFIPRRGVSAIAIDGGVFHDPAADTALFDAVLSNLGDNVEVHDLDLEINDPGFADAMAARLHEMIAARAATSA